MLELYHPLWDKLGEHIPTMLSELAASWDDETAKSLLFDDLCHQETCNGATYAAIPHLLKIAAPEENRRQRRESRLFSASSRFARATAASKAPASFTGYPETLEGWDRIGEPVTAADLEKILSIKASFFSALPAIRALCERALLENEDVEAAAVDRLSQLHSAKHRSASCCCVSAGIEGLGLYRRPERGA
jgi:hypothetical protein